MKKIELNIELNAAALEKQDFKIVKKLFETSLQKSKTLTTKNIVDFVKKYKEIISKKLHYLRNFTFEDITLYVVPKIMKSEQVESLCDVMKNAESFLDNVYSKFCELENKQLSA